MLFELQQFASSLAYTQVAEPQVYVDPTYQWIAIGEQTLHLQNLRDGMQKLIQTAKDMYLCLSGDDAWVGLPIGLKVVDDLGNMRRGYSFLDEPPFRNERHTFFLALVERRRLGTVMADGTWAWDHVAVREFLDSADRLWGHVIHALYVGAHLSTRVTQFLQHQIRNADRPRNLFFQGEEGFFFTRYSKTMHLKGRDSCIPAFLSEPLRELLLVLLGSGFREAQAILAGVVYGAEARWLYRTYVFCTVIPTSWLSLSYLSYLCVAYGKRTTPEEFCRDFPKRNHETFSCQWGARDFRQGMITLAHQFISPNESFACADDLLAEAADHSAEVDVGHYAVVHGTLPRVTNNQMNKHRCLAEEWGSLLGLGPFSPPEPVGVVRRKARPTKTPEANELATQVATLAADAVMDRLTSLGLTRTTIDALNLAASRQLALSEAELDGSPPSTPPASHAGWFPDRVKNISEADDCVPPSPLSPYKGEDTPMPSAIPNSRSSPARKQHLFEMRPKSSDEGFKSPASSSQHAQLTGQHRRAVTESSQILESPRPSKRPRLYRGAMDTQVIGKGDNLRNGQGHDSADSFIIRSALTPTNAGTQSSSSSVGEEFVSLMNVNNPSMANEDDLQENIRHTLRELLNDPHAREKSRAQMLAIMAVMRREQDTVITIRTGGGKSMLWMIPPLLDESIHLIVVSPYSVLLDEQCQKATDAGLRAASFKLSKRPPKDTQILFVQVEHVSRKSALEK